MTSGPVQPQCFLSMNEPIPSMSAAGSERVKVTQRKFRSFCAVNSLSSTITISGKPRIGSSRTERAAERRDVAVAVRGTDRPLDRQDARQHHAGIAEAVGQAQAGGQLGGQRAPHRARGRDHDLRALVQPVARVVERVDRRPGLEVQVGRPVDPLEQVARGTPGCRGCRATGRLRGRRSSRYFASDSCPWPRRALAMVRISCGRRTVGIGHVALAGDGQEQRVDAGGVDGVDGVDARDHAGDDRPGQLVDQGAEGRVFLRRPSHRRERPDGTVAVIDAFDLQAPGKSCLRL